MPTHPGFVIPALDTLWKAWLPFIKKAWPIFIHHSTFLPTWWWPWIFIHKAARIAPDRRRQNSYWRWSLRGSTIDKIAGQSWEYPNMMTLTIALENFLKYAYSIVFLPALLTYHPKRWGLEWWHYHWWCMIYGYANGLVEKLEAEADWGSQYKAWHHRIHLEWLVFLCPHSGDGAHPWT